MYERLDITLGEVLPNKNFLSSDLSILNSFDNFIFAVIRSMVELQSFMFSRLRFKRITYKCAISHTLNFVAFVFAPRLIVRTVENNFVTAVNAQCVGRSYIATSVIPPLGIFSIPNEVRNHSTNYLEANLSLRTVYSHGCYRI